MREREKSILIGSLTCAIHFNYSLYYKPGSVTGIIPPLNPYIGYIIKVEREGFATPAGICCSVLSMLNHSMKIEWDRCVVVSDIYIIKCVDVGVDDELTTWSYRCRDYNYILKARPWITYNVCVCMCPLQKTALSSVALGSDRHVSALTLCQPSQFGHSIPLTHPRPPSTLPLQKHWG